MFRFLRDLLYYPFDNSPDNRFGQFLNFVLKDYPVYFRARPTRKKIILFFVLMIKIIWSWYDAWSWFSTKKQ